MSLHVDIIGSGPPLVLLHGWAMHGGIFAPLVETLRKQRTLYVVDLPGHGHSRDCGVPLTLEACADAVLSNDSGLMHIAAALQKPLAVIYGSTSPEHTPPLTKQVSIISNKIECSPCFERECPKVHHKCLRELMPQQVLIALNALIAQPAIITMENSG